MSFLHELKRRNVFRVGIAYGVVSWVLLQGIDFSLDLIGAPNWIMQVFMLLGLVGMPLVLIFAWVFERTPEGFKRESEIDPESTIRSQTGHKIDRVVVIFLGIAVLILLADKFITPEADIDTQAETAIPEVSVDEPAIAVVVRAIPEEHSIAVLPFVNMSSDPNQEYFSDGISEEILNVLVRLQDLKVVGRTSSFSFKGKNQDLRTIGEALNVAYILEGSVRKAGERVRITAQLIQAKDGFHLWSNSFDRELTDIFAVQDEIATAIAKSLAIELKLDVAGTELAPAKTSNMAAYDRYLEARGLIAQRHDFRRIIKLLTEATQLDPEFAEGWAANAQAHSLSIYYLEIDRKEYKDQAEIMANRALEIDPQLSMAHSVLGDIYRDRYQWTKAQASYLHALALNPDEIEANVQYAQMLWRISYFTEALKYSSRAVELDPLSWINLTVHAGIRSASGDLTGGWADLERVLESSGKGQDFPLRQGIQMALSMGKVERAIELTQSLSTTGWAMSGEAQTKAYLDQLIPNLNSKEKTLAFLAEHLDQSISLGFASPWAADIYWAAHYGDYGLTEKIMEQGIQLDERLGVMDLSWFNYGVISTMHNSAPYKNLIRRTNLDDYWREYGFPANCKSIGDDDFVCN